MSIVHIPSSCPTEEDYKQFQRVLSWIPSDERHYAAGGYCPFFEYFPTEYGDYGCVVYPGTAACHHLAMINRPLTCDGQYCNCPLSVETWEGAWISGLIDEY